MHVLVGIDGLGRAPALTDDAALALLDARERGRLAGLRHPADREAFVAAHAALRWVAAERLGRDPDDVVIDTTNTGRPVLRDDAAHVSLARRRGVVAVVVHDTPVGIDVERCPPDVDVRAVSRRFFPRAEAEAVTSAADPASAFCRLWVRKEAVGKALDLMLEEALAIPVGAAVVAVPSASGTPRSVRLRDLPCPPGIVAASAAVESD